MRNNFTPPLFIIAFFIYWAVNRLKLVIELLFMFHVSPACFFICYASFQSFEVGNYLSTKNLLTKLTESSIPSQLETHILFVTYYKLQI